MSELGFSFFSDFGINFVPHGGYEKDTGGSMITTEITEHSKVFIGRTGHTVVCDAMEINKTGKFDIILVPARCERCLRERERAGARETHVRPREPVIDHS